jgi:hypothetical protein
MKTLSLKQPFAELVVCGRKTIELRNWNTSFRGEFLIHASKNPDFKAMEKFGFEKDALPCGFIVGKAKLVGVREYRTEEEHNRDVGKHLADSSWGKYGFILESAERFDKLIEVQGKLGFWDFDGSLD